MFLSLIFSILCKCMRTGVTTFLILYAFYYVSYKLLGKQKPKKKEKLWNRISKC